MSKIVYKRTDTQAFSSLVSRWDARSRLDPERRQGTNERIADTIRRTHTLMRLKLSIEIAWETRCCRIEELAGAAAVSPDEAERIISRKDDMTWGKYNAIFACSSRLARLYGQKIGERMMVLQEALSRKGAANEALGKDPGNRGRQEALAKAQAGCESAKKALTAAWKSYYSGYRKYIDDSDLSKAIREYVSVETEKNLQKNGIMVYASDGSVGWDTTSEQHTLNSYKQEDAQNELANVMSFFSFERRDPIWGKRKAEWKARTEGNREQEGQAEANSSK